MKTKQTKLYAMSFLSGTLFLAEIIYLKANLNWQSFMDAAIVFVSDFFFICMSILFLGMAIYLFDKAKKTGRKKQHVRFL